MGNFPSLLAARPWRPATARLVGGCVRPGHGGAREAGFDALGLRRSPNGVTMSRMAARLCIVLLAVAVLTLARAAYAQNINITIQGDPWKASPSEERQQYLRGREADKMIRKGYICYHEAGTAPGCTWAKPERERTERVKAHWGDCWKDPYDYPKGRICERVTPEGYGRYHDFERPLVSLVEKIRASRGPATIRLMAALLKKGKDIFERSTDEQREGLEKNFGAAMDEAFRKVDPEGWKAAQAKEAAEAPRRGVSPSGSAPDAVPVLVEKIRASRGPATIR
ncbi:MAG TPA: hypothetical protein VJ860_03480, partial [Polyangia bacterium]|nr:hypothetical protein [Polyangia bacterium]